MRPLKTLYLPFLSLDNLNVGDKILFQVIPKTHLFGVLGNLGLKS